MIQGHILKTYKVHTLKGSTPKYFNPHHDDWEYQNAYVKAVENYSSTLEQLPDDLFEELLVSACYATTDRQMEMDKLLEEVDTPPAVITIERLEVYIDPPEGWKYGFPKLVPVTVTDLKKWLLNEGYPVSLLDKYGDPNMYRTWSKEE